MNLENRLFGGKRPVFLAPMAGVTDAPFRKLAIDFGASAAVSEMTSVEGIVRRNAKTLKRLPDAGERSLKIVQIVGSNPESAAESASINEELGADVIDINMGCPVRKVVSCESGAALMKNEDLAVKIAESVVKAVKIPVTLKMRLGWDGEHVNFLSLAEKFENVGVRMLTIHCRTRNQMHGGKANWSLIGTLRDRIKIPYLCNGDIGSPEDAVRALEESRAHGIMVGRAALGRPWLPGQILRFLNDGEIIPPPSLERQWQIIGEHFESVLNFYGEAGGVKIFRKHFCWYSSGLKGAARFREIINGAEDISFIKSYAEDFYKRQFRAIL
ncbi:MAG: tRNA dihydrouridine synthase DusB [Holosporaceae bacterium]|jgi:tRNA-dihydrouridine synthase B|nr:tRNA dihydrouridine synthase DusB [Holosporaceae bacterium]